MSTVEKDPYKNIKISNKHHKLLKDYCNKNGFKIHKILEKWIEENLKLNKKDIYGED
jgi:hypothetical protein